MKKSRFTESQIIRILKEYEPQDPNTATNTKEGYIQTNYNPNAPSTMEMVLKLINLSYFGRLW